MTHPQNSARGTFAKKQIRVSASGEVYYEDYSATTALLTGAASGLKVAGGIALSGGTNYLTQNSTAVTLPGGINISNARTITANSTGFVASTVESALPSTDEGAAFTVISNSTGAALAVNSTGTTWKYLNVTSVQPT